MDSLPEHLWYDIGKANGKVRQSDHVDNNEINWDDIFQFLGQCETLFSASVTNPHLALLHSNNTMLMTTFRDAFYATSQEHDIPKVMCKLLKLLGQTIIITKNLSLLLCYAVHHGRLFVCLFLKEIGLSISDLRCDDNFPLRTAARHGHLAICKFLKECTFQVKGKECRLELRDVMSQDNHALRWANKMMHASLPPKSVVYRSICALLQEWGATLTLDNSYSVDPHKTYAWLCYDAAVTEAMSLGRHETLQEAVVDATREREWHKCDICFAPPSWKLKDFERLFLLPMRDLGHCMRLILPSKEYKFVKFVRLVVNGLYMAKWHNTRFNKVVQHAQENKNGQDDLTTVSIEISPHRGTVLPLSLLHPHGKVIVQVRFTHRVDPVCPLFSLLVDCVPKHSLLARCQTLFDRPVPKTCLFSDYVHKQSISANTSECRFELPRARLPMFGNRVTIQWSGYVSIRHIAFTGDWYLFWKTWDVGFANESGNRNEKVVTLGNVVAWDNFTDLYCEVAFEEKTKEDCFVTFIFHSMHPIFVRDGAMNFVICR